MTVRRYPTERLHDPGSDRALSSAPLPPSALDGEDNNADDQRSVEATKDPSPEDHVRTRATQSASLSSPPSRAAEHSALSLPGSCSRLVGYLRTVH